MIPFGTQTVTLFHRSGNGTITRYILTGCSWKTSAVRSLYDGMQKLKSGTSCICRWPADQHRAATGDLFVLGTVTDQVTKATQFAGMLEKYGSYAFVCESFSDNSIANTPLKHFCAKGATVV